MPPTSLLTQVGIAALAGAPPHFVSLMLKMGLISPDFQTTSGLLFLRVQAAKIKEQWEAGIPKIFDCDHLFSIHDIKKLTGIHHEKVRRAIRNGVVEPDFVAEEVPKSRLNRCFFRAESVEKLHRHYPAMVPMLAEAQPDLASDFKTELSLAELSERTGVHFNTIKPLMLSGALVASRTEHHRNKNTGYYRRKHFFPLDAVDIVLSFRRNLGVDGSLSIAAPHLPL